MGGSYMCIWFENGSRYIIFCFSEFSLVLTDGETEKKTTFV